MKKLDILYEDNHIIAVNKSSSDIVQGDKTGDETLSDRVKAYVKRNTISLAMFFWVLYTV